MIEFYVSPPLPIRTYANHVDPDLATRKATVELIGTDVTITPVLGLNSTFSQTWDALALRNLIDPIVAEAQGNGGLFTGGRSEVNVVGSNTADGYLDRDEEAQTAILKPPSSTVTHTYDVNLLAGLQAALAAIGVGDPLP